jgi:site-specific DNA-cytosine methylase
MRNMQPKMFVEDDIRNISVKYIKPLFDGLTGPVVFSGCAPCQPFSKQNRSSRAGDPRRNLLTTRCISLSNGRFGHPEQHRAISAREAACLQTFPKAYRFFGSSESRARQIGNAVPPKMAEAIGRAIQEHAGTA